jgi:hypothetical protein
MGFFATKKNCPKSTTCFCDILEIKIPGEETSPLPGQLKALSQSTKGHILPPAPGTYKRNNSPGTILSSCYSFFAPILISVFAPPP